MGAVKRTPPGVFAYLMDEKGKVLCVRHAYNNREWSLPGGGKEEGECIQIATRREVYEETGLSIEDEELVGIFELMKSEGYVVLVRAEVVTGHLLTDPDEEILEREWFTRDEIEMREGEFYPAQFKLIKWAQLYKPDECPFICPLTLPPILQMIATGPS
ncbi:MAG TPA: hypothetical protein DCZ84_03495 [Candidatus Vogelbacteria bacterium]|uniref:Nudix hydrolase domain-containing protein n=1 Tax=Candidatus Vogelbacteria bacterium RIFOXYD1_FULL_51_18 TaxID=1802440 RepID=A0A1G2QJV4_9BACT|nr:MAG: hypothetical protein A2569_00395 [Candidatus Vogelbacteria bacterium RIFOXYD1_FULL_51_18]HBB65666.1 hypothetical protein [Candidatus Vogelbacteria bacterium]HCQ91854.1 hypothetical protein [Candidatus Vogelbacteria bacterium]